MEICALWRSEDKDGDPQLSGRIDFLDAVVFVWMNKRKTEDEHPDFFLHVIKSDDKKKPGKEKAKAKGI